MVTRYTAGNVTQNRVGQTGLGRHRSPGQQDGPGTLVCRPAAAGKNDAVVAVLQEVLGYLGAVGAPEVVSSPSPLTRLH